MKINEQIKSLGFEGKETLVISAMLEIGMANITDIAIKSGTSRQTAYYIIESLLKRGLVVETMKGKNRHFFTNTKLLLNYYKKREDACKKAKKILQALNVNLKPEVKNTESLPIIEYYRGKAGLENLLKEIILNAKKENNKVFRAYALSNFYPGMEEAFDEFIKKRHKLGITSKIVIPIDTDYNKILGENTYEREFRKMDLKGKGATLYLIGERCYLFSYKDGVGIMIENKTLTEFLTSIFENHWSFLGQK